jgi:hypothetical protein
VQAIGSPGTLSASADNEDMEMLEVLLLLAA